ncbi:hypothetical protein OUZ56_000844 [Daphnia magna]|uniref:Uncharacterized protein n=1 Tax=Daphnia magna TaxID=35525 RepID=A0ABR0A0X5_9CRUS|nr:hypothetical protein OUZ56_000844 [Daphnia magna]
MTQTPYCAVYKNFMVKPAGLYELLDECQCSRNKKGLQMCAAFLADFRHLTRSPAGEPVGMNDELVISPSQQSPPDFYICGGGFVPLTSFRLPIADFKLNGQDPTMTTPNELACLCWPVGLQLFLARVTSQRRKTTVVVSQDYEGSSGQLLG